jgi:D-alanyl-D-alanine carboxypeptidase
VQAVAARDVNALVKRGEEKAIKTSFAPVALNAPVKAGQEIGNVVVTGPDGQQISKVPAVAQAAVPAQSWWKSFWPF